MNARDRLPMPFDIAVIGLGIVGIHQMTREAEELAKMCNRIFLIDSGFGVEDYLRSLCPSVTSLLPRYEIGKSRLPTYRNMASDVIDGALDDAPVGFAVYGHPLVYCYPTTLVQRAAALLDLRVEIVPGISALDTLLIDLGVDPARDGMQMYDATDMLVRRRPLQPDVPCVLWQVTVVEDATYSVSRAPADRFFRLQNYLLDVYPPEHPAFLVFSKNYPLASSVIETYPLAELAVRLAEGSQAGTLFLPPLRERAIMDVQLAERIAATA